MANAAGMTAQGKHDNFVIEMPTLQTVAVLAMILGLLCLPAGCKTVSVTSARSEVEARDPHPSHHHIAILKNEVPDRAHKVIGSVRARVKLTPYTSNVWPEDKIVKKLRTEARKLGGDALINLTATPVRGGGTYVDPTLTVGQVNTQLWTASVIVWLD